MDATLAKWWRVSSCLLHVSSKSQVFCCCGQVKSGWVESPGHDQSLTIVASCEICDLSWLASMSLWLESNSLVLRPQNNCIFSFKMLLKHELTSPASNSADSSLFLNLFDFVTILAIAVSILATVVWFICLSYPLILISESVLVTEYVNTCLTNAFLAPVKFKHE